MAPPRKTALMAESWRKAPIANSTPVVPTDDSSASAPSSAPPNNLNTGFSSSAPVEMSTSKPAPAKKGKGKKNKYILFEDFDVTATVNEPSSAAGPSGTNQFQHNRNGNRSNFTAGPSGPSNFTPRGNSHSSGASSSAATSCGGHQDSRNRTGNRGMTGGASGAAGLSGTNNYRHARANYSSMNGDASSAAGPSGTSRYQHGAITSRGRQGPTPASDISGAMMSLNLGSTSVVQQSALYQEFHPFGRLPTELRVKIWKLCCDSPRILEVCWDTSDKSYESKQGCHYFYWLANASCRAPAIMHVNFEAREEGKKYYNQVTFTTRPTMLNSCDKYKPCIAFKTWYNPEVDVIFFGENSCMNTVVRFLRDQQDRNVEIKKIAVAVTGTLLGCHDWHPDDYDDVVDEVAYGYAINGGCNFMQALHGIHESKALTTMASGAKVLEKVYCVVPTFIQEANKPGMIDESIWFRPARSQGMTSGQTNQLVRLRNQIESIEAGNPLPNCGGLDNWTNEPPELFYPPPTYDEDGNFVEQGDPAPEIDPKDPQRHHEDYKDNIMPKFEFVSLTPCANQGYNYDAVTLTHADFDKVGRDQFYLCRQIENKLNVHVKIPRQNYVTQTQREIGLYGTAENIDKAKHMICEHIESLEGKSVMKLSWAGYRSTGDVDYWGADSDVKKAASRY